MSLRRPHLAALETWNLACWETARILVGESKVLVDGGFAGRAADGRITEDTRIWDNLGMVRTRLMRSSWRLLSGMVTV